MESKPRLSWAGVQTPYRLRDRLDFLPNLAARALRQRTANALGIELNASGRRLLGNVQDSFLVKLTITARGRAARIITFAAGNYLGPSPSTRDCSPPR